MADREPTQTRANAYPRVGRFPFSARSVCRPPGLVSISARHVAARGQQGLMCLLRVAPSCEIGQVRRLMGLAWGNGVSELNPNLALGSSIALTVVQA